MRGSSTERGFSLVVVLLVVTALSLVTSAAYMLSASDAVTASARSYRALALEAASAALSRYQGVAQPSLDAGATVPLVEESVGTFDLDGDGAVDYEIRYRVESAGADLLQNSVRVRAIGEVVAQPEGSIVARASVSSVLTTERFIRPYEDTINLGAAGGGVQQNIPLGPRTVLPVGSTPST